MNTAKILEMNYSVMQRASLQPIVINNDFIMTSQERGRQRIQQQNNGNPANKIHPQFQQIPNRSMPSFHMIGAPISEANNKFLHNGSSINTHKVRGGFYSPVHVVHTGVQVAPQATPQQNLYRVIRIDTNSRPPVSSGVSVVSASSADYTVVTGGDVRHLSHLPPHCVDRSFGAMDKNTTETFANSVGGSTLSQVLESRVCDNKTVPPSARDAISSARVPREADDVKWKLRFQELCSYKKKKGDCLVPTRSIEFFHLGPWVSTQRAEFKKLTVGMSSSLTDERVKMLNSIGFTWRVDVPWKVRFNELIIFKRQCGHCDVPRSYKDNPRLGRWVHAQRSAYKSFLNGSKSKITQERVNLLQSIGFNWKVGIRRKNTRV